jgi:glycosyltransferase involved in cell wall biosynthesis
LVAPHDKAETVDGVRIDPVARPRNRLTRMTRTVMEVWRKARENQADIYHFHDPELLPVGVLLKRAGKRVIYDVHEHVVNDILAKGWIPPSLRRMIAGIAGSFEKLSVRKFDAVIAATPFIAGTFPGPKTTLVQNFPRWGEFLNCNTALPYRERGYRAVYVGLAQRSRGAREMVAAANLIPSRFGARLALVGGIESAELRRDLSTMDGWERIDSVGFQARAGVVRHVADARAGLVVLHPTPGFINSQPVKLFEYMAAGIPVIASNFPDWRRFVDDIGCGISVNPLDPQAIADAITWLFDNPRQAELMGIRGQNSVRSTYNWDGQAQNLLRLYEEVLS